VARYWPVSDRRGLISKLEFSIFLEWDPLRLAMSQGQPARTAATASMAARMFEDATEYRERAEEALQLAEKFINPLDREVWLRVAGEWLKLAQNADMQAKE
jgi:hypothetical protein